MSYNIFTLDVLPHRMIYIATAYQIEKGDKILISNYRNYNIVSYRFTHILVEENNTD